MQKVESFKLDHTKVKAPYIRKCCVLDGVNGDKVTKFDLRFLQPNAETFGTAAIHGLEHLLATYLRETLDNIIDLSPMGCRTGFYLIMWGEVEPQAVKEGLESALDMVLKVNEMPAASAIECGNYKDLSLFGAKEYAREALEKGFSLNIYGE
ncbi:S-ribosylhomocysteine lyase [Romboutsia sedimentorum]|uniref:S-ribosylhomocysteine lyase n=1 Tax=Romboutsia sedimentorum TaxID=1368474 RepID=A0ABT7EBZ6_9FIRM|nr:S-ribosylhomocysteine lyase [Romboutsia sedimentorum]MDK2564462.1 S-ribosylhomocysteine lyase [Romboutsia sedimentorum]